MVVLFHGECSSASQKVYIWCLCAVDGGDSDTRVRYCGGPRSLVLHTVTTLLEERAICTLHLVPTTAVSSTHLPPLVGAHDLVDHCCIAQNKGSLLPFPGHKLNNIDNFINSNKFGQELKITPQHFLLFFYRQGTEEEYSQD